MAGEIEEKALRIDAKRVDEAAVERPEAVAA